MGLTWKKEDLNMVTEDTNKDLAKSRKFDLIIMYLSGLLGNPRGNELLATLQPNLKEKLFVKHMDELFKILVDHEFNFFSLMCRLLVLLLY